MSGLDLTRYPPVKLLLRSRWPQFIARAITLAGFIFTILAGLTGSLVGSHNFAIIFVWIAWWTALKLVFIPLGGRSWCSICPIPLPGEWMQRGGILETRGRGIGLGRRWPKRLRGNWLQVGGFAIIGVFSATILTSSRLTGAVLAGLFILAAVTSLVFEHRAFCSYICPIGGFSGLYANLAPTELRIKEKAACATHQEKTCYRGCPWGAYPAALTQNTNCGLCMECLRVCPKDNIAVNLRPFGADLAGPAARLRLDETFLAVLMLGSALMFSAVFLGPWGALKTAAYSTGTAAWFGYAGAFLAITLVVLPALFLLAVWTGRRVAHSPESFRKVLGRQSQVLVPLGLAAWIAFTIAFATSKVGYLLPVVADPFGWGWNLFGIARLSIRIDITTFSLLLQASTVALGLFWSGSITRRVTQESGSGKPAILAALPVLAFSLLYGLALLYLLIG